ncbi:MAG TPA: hypothetical protein VJ032_02585, partial [Thermoanaerobaculia bacterium]|nr:hypothetical protein [Thermoanaerobaculia bacterium]
FSQRGAYRLPNVMSSNLAVRWAYPLARAEFFAQGDVLNVFNKRNIIPVNGGPSVNTTVNTSTTAGFTTALQAFNPATTTPIECPQGAPLAQCTTMGANWQKGPNFGKLVNGGSTANYQTPRTVRMSFGVRF